MARETVQVSRPYEGLLRSSPQCGRKRKSTYSRSDLFCLGLSLVLYALPAWKELDGFNLGLFEDAIWYVYFLPGVLLAYYYGFRGSILNAAVSMGIVFITEVHKRSMHSDRPYPGLDDVVLMVGLTTLASLSVGFMAAFPEDAGSPSGLIQAADDALRKAKREGKDTVIIHCTMRAAEREER